MNWGVLIAVLIYEVVSIVGIGAFMAYKNKKKGGAESGSFAFAGGGLPASLVGITLPCKLHLTDRCFDRWCDLNRRITGQKRIICR